MNFEDFLKLLPKIKNIPLPGEASQAKMAPPFRETLIKKQKEALKTAKQAGVLALFYPNLNNEITFVLILRKTYKGVHSAQVAFPGGKIEPYDISLKDTALRETFEEVGVSIKTMEIVKALTQIYIPPSHFYVQPYIGVTRKTPHFIKQEDEVEAIIEVPIKHFLNDNMVVEKKVKTSYSIEVKVPAFKLNNHIVWGATAMMLSEIKDLLKKVL